MRRWSAVLVPLVGLVLTVPAGAAATVSSPLPSPDARAAALGSGPAAQADEAAGTGEANESAEAGEALESATELLDEDAATTPAPQPAPGLEADSGRDVTLALRDLVLLRGSLDRSERARADALLARPTDSGGGALGTGYTVAEQAPRCSGTICVHRVASTPDKATGAYARLVLDTVTRVAETLTRGGYRAPEGDGVRGGDSRTDIYLADIGDRGVYGYCTTDPAPEPRPHHTWAYCVLDNDYDRAQYPRRSPLENLQVTAAHEYFHAVQFGYDVTEDAYLLEGTATWVEDEVYDSIDDNAGYLRYGPMRRPGAPLDKDRGGLEVYGAWGFFRFLTERLPAREGQMPTLVRDVWRQADAVDGAPDRYSLQAVRSVLASRSTTLAEELTEFSVANRRPERFYEEARVNDYPRADVADTARLGARQRRYSDRRRTDHLTSHTYRFVPRAGLGSRWRLRVDLDLPPARRGSVARVSLLRRDGSVSTSPVRLDGTGGARVTRGFASTRVRAVEVTVVNASARIERCGSLSDISCGGRARDDRVAVQVDARLVRR